MSHGSPFTYRDREWSVPCHGAWLGYTGRAFDESTGLQNNLNRWYDPLVGRWASEDPIGFNASDNNLFRYVGNSPSNAVDPDGLDYISVEGNRVFWVVEQNGWIYNPDVRKFPIGVASGGQVRLFSNNCIVSLGSLRTQANNFWNSFADISGASEGIQRSQIAFNLDAISAGNINNSPHWLEEMASAAHEGAGDGSVVVLDTLSLGQFEPLHDESVRVQRAAIDRGDIGSQVGFFAGKVGAYSAQAALILAGAGGGLAALGTTARGAAFLEGAAPLVNAARLPLAGYGAYKTGQGFGTAINEGRKGNLIGASDVAAQSTVLGVLTASLVAPSAAPVVATQEAGVVASEINGTFVVTVDAGIANQTAQFGTRVTVTATGTISAGTTSTIVSRGLATEAGTSVNVVRPGQPAIARPTAPNRIPHGFSTVDDFSRFGSDLRTGLRRAGFDDVQPVFQGSSVTGKSFRTGQPFDVGRVSDFDVALGSPQLLQRAKALGIPLRSGGVRTGPLKASDLHKLGLTDVASQLSQRAGRPVNFMIFESAGTAAARAPSIPVP